MLADPAITGAADEVKRVIFCSGKVYYDLANYREGNGRDEAALIRIEQLYPFHVDAVVEAVAPYKNAVKFVWCQEESQNMGAWFYIGRKLSALLGREVAYAGRGESASTAVGSLAIHKLEQRLLVEEAFHN